MTRIMVVALAVLAIALAGCAQPQADPSPELDPELGVAPSVSPDEPSPAASPTASAAAPSPSPAEGASPAAAQDAAAPASQGSPPASQSGDGSSGDGGAPQASTPVVLLAVADAAGDHGARGPDWTDLRALELVEVGNDLRVTLRFGGQLPAAPPEGEVPLIAVDIGDDGYQLFVEGGGESWAAYLDTPQGFVAYPGTFELAGSAIVLQVPFNAVGSPTRAPVRAWVEWSRDSGVIGALNPTSEDRLDGEPHRFDRNP